MSAPLVVSVAPGSPAALAGLLPGDEIVARQRAGAPRRHRVAAVAPTRPTSSSRCAAAASTSTSTIAKRAGEPLGAEVSSAVFDRVRTCDNHCEFCFIYQLPKGMRRSLYLKDDDYRLSFLYGNFTTLTRFTEADLERVVTERLSPLHVSIHATDPDVRIRMLKNPRGGMSLRWLRALLDHGIEVRGQIVVCPGVNDGEVLDDTLAGVLDEYPELESVAVVPLGLSQVQHRVGDAAAHARRGRRRGRRGRGLAGRSSCDVLGRRMVFAADEYYLMAGRPFPDGRGLRGLPHARGRHRHGPHVRARVPRRGRPTPPGSAERLLRRGRLPAEPGRLHRPARPARRRRHATTSRSARSASRCAPRRTRARSASSPASFGAQVIGPLDRRRSAATTCACIPVDNEFFGGNTGVTGLMTGADLTRVLAAEPAATATCCPTCACPTTAASSTASPSTTCRDRSRSSPPTASRCDCAAAGSMSAR